MTKAASPESEGGAAIDVTAVNLDTMHVLLADGTLCPITDMIDGDGDMTDDEAAAVVVIAKAPNAWLAVFLTDFATPTLH